MENEENKYIPLGFQVVKTTNKMVEAIACIFCEKTGKFKTKILTFRREIDENEKNNNPIQDNN
jgi:hypothetical protein